MPIKHAIIHAFSSEKQKTQLQLMDQETEIDLPLSQLFNQLKQSLQKSATRQYGFFDPEQKDNPAEKSLDAYRQEKLDFLSMTQQLAEAFKQTIKELEEAQNGHLLFIIETLMDQDLLYVFWLNQQDFQQIDPSNKIQLVKAIDANKIGLSLKMDFSQWQIEGWQQYLTFQAARNNKEINHAFCKMLGFKSGVNLQQQTDEFLQIVDQFTQQLDKDKSQPAKHTIVDYCVEQDMQGKPINFESLSKIVDEDAPKKFAEFVKEHQAQETKEIYAHRNSLKKYVRFFGREKDLSISFSSDRMQQDIVFNPDTGSLTFKSVPKSLQIQLAKYFKQQESSS